jgi:hypothetical protein
MQKSTVKRRYLPPWANEPLKFTFSPDEALARGAMVKPKDWKKTVRTGRKASSRP